VVKKQNPPLNFLLAKNPPLNLKFLLLAKRMFLLAELLTFNFVALLEAMEAMEGKILSSDLWGFWC